MKKFKLKDNISVINFGGLLINNDNINEYANTLLSYSHGYRKLIVEVEEKSPENFSEYVEIKEKSPENFSEKKKIKKGVDVIKNEDNEIS